MCRYPPKLEPVNSRGCLFFSSARARACLRIILRDQSPPSQCSHPLMSRTERTTKHSPDPSGAHVLRSEEVLAFIQSLQHEASMAQKDISDAESPGEPLAVEVNARWKLASHEQGASVEVCCLRACVSRAGTFGDLSHHHLPSITDAGNKLHGLDSAMGGEIWIKISDNSHRAVAWSSSFAGSEYVLRKCAGGAGRSEFVRACLGNRPASGMARSR